MSKREEKRLHRYELHVHTDVSDDGVSTFSEIEEAAERYGLDGFAITDHDTIDGALRLKERGRVPVIVGSEVTTAFGDVIGLFLDRAVPPGLSPEATMDAIHEQGGLVYVPHPFDRKRKTRLFREALERCVEKVDILEVWNGRTPHREDNQRARDYAEERRLVPAIGSDAHTPAELGKATVSLASFESSEGFLESLRKAELHFPARSSGPSLWRNLFSSRRG